NSSSCRRDGSTVLINSFRLDPLNSDTGRFRPYNLFRRHNTLAQHFTYSCTRYIYAEALIVRARLSCGGTVAARTVKNFMKQAHIYAQFFRFKLIEDSMTGILIVIIANSCMIPSYQCMSTSIVLHNQSM